MRNNYTKTKGILFTTCLLLAGSFACNAQQNSKEWAYENYHKYINEAKSVSNTQKDKDIENYRIKYSKEGYRKKQFDACDLNWEESLKRLTSDGLFTDMIEPEKKYFTHEILKNTSYDYKKYFEKYYSIIWLRLGVIADAYATGKADFKTIYTDAYLKAIMHYGNLEIERSNYAPRFHESCFLIPTSAMNMYFAFLKRMDDIESGKPGITTLEKQACDMLKVLALQAWTEPIRNDETDKDVSSVDRFRHHVWWVGGNGLAYRSLLPIACMYKSIPMIDVLAVVASNGISSTSQVNNETSFWTEGFTADGAGWGHGRQCLVWGYPIDGTAAALNMLSTLRGSSWEQKLTETNKKAIFNYLRGSNWYYYKGFNLPCLDRTSNVYSVTKEIIKSKLLIQTLMDDWQSSFTPAELKELKQFEKEENECNINMDGYKNGLYTGTRYFYNNDDLIKKNKDYHVMINMASVRCDGIESAPHMADGYNFTVCDGMTLFQRNGHEYMNILGALDVLQAPGITARLGEEKLTPVTNWRGYCSKHNYAAAATFNGDNAVAGYIFEKMNGSDKEGVNDTVGRKKINEVLYGVKAYKSYFWFGDYMMALGAGITNLKPELEGDIQTTVEQTSKEDDIFLLNGNKKTAITGNGFLSSKNDKNLEWIVQNNKFAYTVLPSITKEAFFSIENRKADWVKKDIKNKKIKNLPEYVDVFEIGISHGAKPQGDKYGYVVYAGKDLPSSKLPFSVLRNDTSVQAAMSNDGKILETVFYKENQVVNFGKNKVSSSVPCVLLMEKDNDSWKVSVTDPTMNKDLKTISLNINGKSHTISLPDGNDLGKPAVTVIK